VRSSVLNVQSSLEAIHALPLTGGVRVLHLSADQERVIALSHLRELLPEQVELLAGPGSGGSLCPASDIYQAIRLCTEHDVTLMVEQDLLAVPGPRGLPGPMSLAEAQAAGADVRIISAPVEALLYAARHPERDTVLFTAGFETLLAPLAGMLLEGIPSNLSFLLCGRRAQALLEHAAPEQLARYDGLLLPGNRSSLLGVQAWEQVAQQSQRPAVVAGYTAQALLSGLEALLRAINNGEVGVQNHFRPMVRQKGNAIALQRLHAVFDISDGRWRGIGSVTDSAYRLRSEYAHCDADRRYPDYRHAVGTGSDFHAECDYAAVISARRKPSSCLGFNQRCAPDNPAGPCMGASDGTCRIHSLAELNGRRSAVVG
jgi:hydrogenase expression/formation protein HypD